MTASASRTLSLPEFICYVWFAARNNEGNSSYNCERLHETLYRTLQLTNIGSLVRLRN